MEFEYDKVLAGLSVVVGVVCFTGNFLLLWVILVRKDGHLRTPSNLFVANLALADMLKSVPGVVPLYVMRILGVTRNFYECVFSMTWTLLMIETAIFTHVTLSLERLVAIDYPYHYVKLFDTKIVAVICAVIWMASSLVYCVVPFLWNNGSRSFHVCNLTETMTHEYLYWITITLGTFIPLVIMVAVYLRIMVIALRQRARMRRDQVLPAGESVHVGTCSICERLISELKTAFRCLVVVVVFVVCQLPQRVVTLLTIRTATGPLAIPVSSFVILINLNAFFNPFLYAFSSVAVRQEMWALIHPVLRCCHRRIHPSVPCTSDHHTNSGRSYAAETPAICVHM